MRPSDLPIDALPAWCEKYGAEVHGLKLADIDGRGNGWIAQEDLTGDEQDGGQQKSLLVIPDGIVASYGAVMQYAPENGQFHQLLHAVQFKVSLHEVVPRQRNTDMPVDRMSDNSFFCIC
jgi:hypothetical protein